MDSEHHTPSPGKSQGRTPVVVTYGRFRVLLTRTLFWFGLGVGTLIVALLTFLLTRAFEARKMPALEAWHDEGPDELYLYRDTYASISDFLNQELLFMDALYESIQPTEKKAFFRYAEGSPSSPYRGGKNLNASFFTEAHGERKGGVLLLHGLTDSPYHMRRLAETFAKQDYAVLALRLPAHGTLPGALTQIAWQDWYAAVRFAVDLLSQEVDELPITLGGFSTGGALALHYTILALQDSDLLVPERVFLFSPALSVSAEARFANWHKVVSWIPAFNKFKWVEILPEYDPFKYNSFPKNAGDQIFRLTRANQALIQQVRASSVLRELMPPMHGFQSLVDQTVSTEAVGDLFSAIGRRDSELMIFDYNRSYEGFLTPVITQQRAAQLLLVDRFEPRLLVLANKPDHDRHGYSHEVLLAHAYKMPQDEEIILTPVYEDSTLAWPREVYALSHVGLPIAPDDAMYGASSLLGGFQPKGEINTLLLSAADLARIRYNPFFSVMEERIIAVLDNTQDVHPQASISPDSVNVVQ